MTPFMGFGIVLITIASLLAFVMVKYSDKNEK